ncbi:MAG: hypothetical protein QE487_13730 [Fluviicola sp.]|nr:hypothetical protein [Fluviicola sp.]
MEQSNDIDLLLTLNPNGWSTFFLFVKDKTINFSITHVFGDPYSDLIQALSSLIKGEKKVSFYWYAEPGGHRIELQKIMTSQHKVIFSISEFQESFSDEPKEFELKIEFELKLKQLTTLFYLQLHKTYVLLRDSEFAKNRMNDFPFREFHQFEKLASYFLQL